MGKTDYNSLNKVMLIGFVSSEIKTGEMKDGGRMWAGFQLATLELFYARGKSKPYIEYHNIVAWGNNSKIARKFLKKNMRVSIEGKLRRKIWHKDGERKERVEIEAEHITFMTKDSPLKPEKEEITKLEDDPF